MAVETILTVTNERGLHLSSAAKIAKLSQQFACNIHLIKGVKVANAKSVLNITGLMAPQGTELRIVADGEDAQQAVVAMKELFQNRFEEDQ